MEIVRATIALGLYAILAMVVYQIVKWGLKK